MQIRASAVVLITANLIPLAGVLLLDWRVFDIMILYWVENVVIGAVNVLRMLTSAFASRAASNADKQDVGGFVGSVDITRKGRPRWFLIPFFIVHYSAFCYGHYLAVIAIFGGSDGAGTGLDELLAIPGEFWRSPYWIGVVAIAVSHLFSFFGNFIAAGEYRRTSPAQLMKRPYGRIVVLHIAVIAGGALVSWLGNPLPALLVLIALKIVIDVRLHVRERLLFDEVL